MKKESSARWLFWLVTWGGLGKSKWAPGSWGTLGGLILIPLFHLGGAVFYLFATMVLFLVAVVGSHVYVQTQKRDDPQEVVIDEVLGIVVALYGIPLSWQSLLSGFILFRLLDIAKPFPISFLDKRIKGGIGIVLDDAVAGIVTQLILNLIVYHTHWLGVV